MINELKNKMNLRSLTTVLLKLLGKLVVILGVGIFLGPAVFVGYICLTPHLCEITHSFFEAVEQENKEAVLKYAKAYEKWEGKAIRRITRETVRAKAKHPYVSNPYLPELGAIGQKIYYMLAYEVNGDYDKALAYEAELSEMMKSYRPAEESVICYSSPYDRARILYKKGLKKEAFIEYCSIGLIDEDYASWEKSGSFSKPEKYNDVLKRFKEREQKLITQQEQDKKWRSALSCFANYDEFLDFLNAEYEELDRPEEYAGAVAKYRLLALDQGWDREPPVPEPEQDRLNVEEKDADEAATE